MLQRGEPFAFLTRSDGEWLLRIDAPRHAGGKKHIHIWREKKLEGTYSWKIDGTRHDAGKFPKNEKWIKGARGVASRHLGLPESSFQLLTAERFSRIEVFAGRPRSKPMLAMAERRSPRSRGGLVVVLCSGRHLILIIGGVNGWGHR